MDIACDARRGHRSVDGTRTAERLRAVCLSTHSLPVPAAPPCSVAPALAGGSAPRAASAPAAAPPEPHAPNELAPAAGTAPPPSWASCLQPPRVRPRPPPTGYSCWSDPSRSGSRPRPPRWTPVAPWLPLPRPPRCARLPSPLPRQPRPPCARLGDPPGLTAPSAASSVIAAPVSPSTAAPFATLDVLVEAATLPGTLGVLAEAAPCSAAPAPATASALRVGRRAKASAAAPPQPHELPAPRVEPYAAPGGLPAHASPSPAASTAALNVIAAPDSSSVTAPSATLGVLAVLPPSPCVGAGPAAAPGDLAHVCLWHGTVLQFRPGSCKAAGSACAARFAAYRSERSVGEFFHLYPGPPGVA